MSAARHRLARALPLLPLLGLLLGLLLGAGCKPPAEVPAPTPPPAREPVELLAPGGERTLLLAAEEDGYRLQDRAGWAIGRVVIEGGAVRVTDRGGDALVTVTQTDSGFLLAGAGPELVGTEGEGGMSLTRGGVEVARWRGQALSAGGSLLQVARNDAYAQVLRDGETVVEVRGPSGAGAAYLAWSELPFPERVALLVFHAEAM